MGFFKANWPGVLLGLAAALLYVQAHRVADDASVAPPKIVERLPQPPAPQLWKPTPQLPAAAPVAPPSAAPQPAPKPHIVRHRHVKRWHRRRAPPQPATRCILFGCLTH